MDARSSSVLTDVSGLATEDSLSPLAACSSTATHPLLSQIGAPLLTEPHWIRDGFRRRKTAPEGNDPSDVLGPGVPSDVGGKGGSEDVRLRAQTSRGIRGSLSKIEHTRSVKLPRTVSRRTAARDVDCRQAVQGGSPPKKNVCRLDGSGISTCSSTTCGTAFGSALRASWSAGDAARYGGVEIGAMAVHHPGGERILARPEPYPLFITFRFILLESPHGARQRGGSQTIPSNLR